MTDEVIKINKLSKEYITDAGTVPVLHEVSLSVKPGEFVAIMGPSGSGKSTFMNILGCLDVASNGQYLLNGRDVNQQSSDELALLRNQVIGFVFQGFNLLPRANLEDNVALPLIYRGLTRAERIMQARVMLEKVGLGKYHHSRPNQISGGQQQRVAIARALVNHPKLLLADEPTGNLDTHTSQEIMQLFSELNNRDGITIVLITHEHDIAAYAHRLVRLADGRVIYDGPVAGDPLVHAAHTGAEV
ncbi:MAG: macrolide ABC transporter ATP-binding protein [Gallionellales bacterium 35-53-114]|jgi:putative ABC transport system ATP-binding protein|nr:MAG: macrolide ABC transporter ATP-binding protein [Gallionellales bacterium 35-53-114]OYZ62984.1 MAG: macrolide ABC transporter ATP-binding protein [Gallionellales bacterium 24-53-125]OZB09035.1 MAG: macrolide ABC transporter ATP-binding protein [Gallionellales bacterium 39-52-133]HQS59282.1 ABC transporter ATP-binding protein [Gallionellaceae bacterium]HQS76195.1 ABC transporter ATP-binding protein [Gallionellaceae bacterium]